MFSNINATSECFTVIYLKAKYQVFKDVAGKYRFRLRAENNKIVAVSEAYEQKAGVMNGVKSVQTNCQSKIEDKTGGSGKLTFPKYQVFTDDDSKFRFNLSASNGEIIAASEAYQTKQGVMNGVEAVKRSCDAEIEDMTLTQPEPESPYKNIMESAIIKEKKQAVSSVMAAPLAKESGKAPLSGPTKLEFAPPKTAKNGATVTFTGKLLTKDSGEAVSEAKVDILEADRSFMKDDIMASGTTAEDGSFNIDWKAKPMDWWDNTNEVYALFKGKGDLKPTCSKKSVMTVS